MAKKILTDLDFASASRIRNLPAPVNSDEPARLGDLNSAIEGIAWKDSVRVATQTNLNLASPGASIDGITMAAGDRVLARAQTTTSQNGIYVWNGAAVAMTRSADASTAAELEGAATTVEEGTSAGVTYRQTAVNFTLDSGAVAWTTFGTAAPSASETTAGIAEIATQAETDTGTDDLHFITPLKLKTSSLLLKKYTTTVGDGSATQIDVTHNLNSLAVQVQLFEVSSGLEVMADITINSVNVVRLNFTAAPAAGQYRVVVIA